MPFKTNNPGCDCCPTGCEIDPGWECDVKNGITSSDLTGWSVDSGTWNATQSWESGTTADTLTTSSTGARISCDTAQSGPLDDRLRVRHRVKVTNAADEAVILLAGFKVVLMSGSVKIYDTGGSLLTSHSEGIGLNTEADVWLCTWYDSGTSLEYIGLVWGTHSLVAEVTLGTDGTTEFGCDSVTGAVSFHHAATAWFRDGRFYHNTTLADGTDCKSCVHEDCLNVPDLARYYTITISGLSNAGSAPSCNDCPNLDASFVVDTTSTDSYCHWYTTPVKICDNAGAAGGPVDVWCYPILYVSNTAVRVRLWTYSVDYRTTGTVYDGDDAAMIDYSLDISSSKPKDVDDDLSYESTTGTHADDCVGWDSLTVHVTASES